MRLYWQPMLSDRAMASDGTKGVVRISADHSYDSLFMLRGTIFPYQECIVCPSVCVCDGSGMFVGWD